MAVDRSSLWCVLPHFRTGHRIGITCAYLILGKQALPALAGEPRSNDVTADVDPRAFRRRSASPNGRDWPRTRCASVERGNFSDRRVRECCALAARQLR